MSLTKLFEFTSWTREAWVHTALVMTQSGPFDTFFSNCATANRATYPATHMQNMDLSQKTSKAVPGAASRAKCWWRDVACAILVGDPAQQLLRPSSAAAQLHQMLGILQVTHPDQRALC